MNPRASLQKWGMIVAGIAVAAIIGILLVPDFLPDAAGPSTPTDNGSSQPTSTPSPEWETLSVPVVSPGRETLSVSNLDALSELGHFGDGWPAALGYSPDGSHLAIGTARGVEIYQTSDWKVLAAFPFSSPVLAVLYSPDEKWLAAGLQDGSVFVLDSATGKIIHKLTVHSRPVHGLAFSGWKHPEASPALLATGAEDGSIAVWDLQTGMARNQFENPLFGYWGYGVRSLAFSPDDTILLTGGDQGYIARWDLATGEELSHLQTQHGLLFSIAFSPDGSRLASACGDGTVQIWDYATTEPLVLLEGHSYGAWSVAWRNDGKRLATGAGDGTIKIWDPATGILQREKSAAFTKIDILQYSPDDSQLAAVSAGERALVLDEPTLSGIHSFGELIGGLRSAAFEKSGEWAALAGENGLAYYWNLLKGSVVALGDPRPSSKTDITAVFSPEGGTLAVSDGLPGVLRMFDLKTLSLRTETRMPQVRSIAFSPDGSFLAVGGSGEVIILETASGESTQIKATSRFASLAFPEIPGDDHSYLAGGLEDGSVLVWKLGSGEDPLELSAVGNPTIWSLTASGSILAAADDRGDIRIWNLATGKLIRTLYGYSGSLFCLAISPDQKILAAGGIMGSLRFWSLTSGILLRVVPAHNGWINGLAFSPDGKWILSAGSDGSGRIWGVSA
jgi:WD40 repeat protein